MSYADHELKLDTREAGNAVVIEAHGTIDSMTSEDLLNKLLEHVTDSQANLVCDLDGVTYVSSAGLRALLGAMKEARTRGGDLRLAAVSDRVLKVLMLSGFTSILKVYPDADQAAASYQS